MDTKAVIEKVGKSVVMASHQHFTEAHLDNSEYLSAIRELIEAIGKVAGELIGPAARTNMVAELRGYARQLFLETWLGLATDGDGNIDVDDEKDEAIKIFDEIYSSRGHRHG